MPCPNLIGWFCALCPCCDENEGTVLGRLWPDDDDFCAKIESLRTAYNDTQELNPELALELADTFAACGRFDVGVALTQLVPGLISPYDAGNTRLLAETLQKKADYIQRLDVDELVATSVLLVGEREAAMTTAQYLFALIGQIPR
ncbi:MAG: hypothetical protein M3R24_20640 [Chloroflexota bacterium]|nr:hypothetical protein [Chloroflexota bacterium]